MAWIDKKKRSDGGVSARVVWRLGGARDGAYQSETFSAGTDAMNMERARGFKSMVDAAGQRWPAKLMHVTQGRVSQIESGQLDSSELGTLRSYVEALGGTLRVVADFGDLSLTLAD